MALLVKRVQNVSGGDLTLVGQFLVDAAGWVEINPKDFGSWAIDDDVKTKINSGDIEIDGGSGTPLSVTSAIRLIEALEQKSVFNFMKISATTVPEIPGDQQMFISGFFEADGILDLVGELVLI